MLFWRNRAIHSCVFLFWPVVFFDPRQPDLYRKGNTTTFTAQKIQWTFDSRVLTITRTTMTIDTNAPWPGRTWPLRPAGEPDRRYRGDGSGYHHVMAGPRQYPLESKEGYYGIPLIVLFWRKGPCYHQWNLPWRIRTTWKIPKRTKRSVSVNIARPLRITHWQTISPGHSSAPGVDPRSPRK